MMTTVGICEDDDALRQIVRSALEREGWAVRATACGTEAMRAFSDGTAPEVLVLDIGLPDADGRDVCQALRARGVTAPVIFLTARDAITDRVSGFHAGGDDYLTKPFAVAELIVRVHALARRGREAEARASCASELSGADRRAGALGAVLDPSRHGISADASNGVSVRLTPTEYRLLAAVCAAGGRVVRREALIATAWPNGAMVSENTLDAYISRVRAKLRRAGRLEQIENVRGVGYTLR